MDAQQVIAILNIVRIAILSLVSIVACLYAIPICFIRQFHKPLHLLTLNVCIAAFICTTYWAIYYLMNAYYPQILWTPQSCLPIIYVQNMVVCQVIYALCMISLNRLFAIVYKNNALFPTKKWIGICVGAQWIFATLIPLPILASNYNGCLIFNIELIYRRYLIIIVVVIPAISLIITNSIIFIYVRRSSRRVQPMNVGSAQAATLSRREAYLLKHMIFMLAVYLCGWAPIYIILAVNLSLIATAFSPVGLQIFLTMPVVSILINVVDLFLYNHELRKYFTNKRQMDENTLTRQ